MPDRSGAVANAFDGQIHGEFVELFGSHADDLTMRCVTISNLLLPFFGLLPSYLGENVKNAGFWLLNRLADTPKSLTDRPNEMEVWLFDQQDGANGLADGANASADTSDDLPETPNVPAVASEEPED